MMDLLPNEIVCMILEHLSPGSMSHLSLCSGRYYQLVLPYLFKSLQITVGHNGADDRGMKMIRTFHENPNRRRLLQHIAVSSPEWQDRLWEPLYRLFCCALSGLLTSLPCTSLKSFEWRLKRPLDISMLSYLPRCILKLHLEQVNPSQSCVFPATKELSCNGISSIETVKWIKWHVLQAKLGKLCLGYETINASSDLSRYLDLYAIPSTTLNNLTHLRLERVHLMGWPFETMTGLQSLSLQECDHVDGALQSHLLAGESNLTLRELFLTILNKPVDLEQILFQMSQKTRLQSLCIRTFGHSNRPSILSLLRFGTYVRHLELESRSIAMDPQSVHLYSIGEVAQITSQCLLLRDLSIPIDLKRENRRTRVSPTEHLIREAFVILTYQCQLQITPRCRLSHVHQRCHRLLLPVGKSKEALVDAKYLAKPFLRAQQQSLHVSVGNEYSNYHWKMSRNKQKRSGIDFEQCTS